MTITTLGRDVPAGGGGPASPEAATSLGRSTRRKPTRSPPIEARPGGPCHRFDMDASGGCATMAPASSLGDTMFERLFGGQVMEPGTAERIPPGQYKTDKFPVLHYGSVPRTD